MILKWTVSVIHLDPSTDGSLLADGYEYTLPFISAKESEVKLTQEQITLGKY